MSTLEAIAVGVLVCLIWRLLHPRRDRAAAALVDIEDFGPPPPPPPTPGLGLPETRRAPSWWERILDRLLGGRSPDQLERRRAAHTAGATAKVGASRDRS